MEIRRLNETERTLAIALSLDVFTTCGNADYNEEGLETFKRFIYDDKRIGQLVFWGAFAASDKIVGILAVNEKESHLSLFFILPDFHRRGVGKALFEAMTSEYPPRLLTVNASTAALPFYKRLGFCQLNTPQCNHGLVSVPMLKHALRTATTADIPQIRALFRSTVLTINTRDYTADEAVDWASCGDDTCHWEKLIAQLYFLVAVDSKGCIIGFSAIRSDGYLHSLFVHKDWQGKGVASALLTATEQYATERQLPVITSEVSITARPFFEKRGYRIEEVQTRQANRLYLKNFKMKKLQ